MNKSRPSDSFPLNKALWVALLIASLLSTLAIAAVTAADPRYSEQRASRDGIGRVYMGREISRVMGHLGAGWLERPGREQDERTDLLLAALALEPGDIVADIGAGTGYFTFPMAQRVAPHGRVLAVDIQTEMLDIIAQRIAAEEATNVLPVLGTERDPNLGGHRVDLVLMVDAYHEFSYPYEVMRNVVDALADDGQVILVEYRGEDPSVPIKPLHKMTVTQASREMAEVGLELQELIDSLPWQHIMVFSKTANTTGSL